MVPDPVEVGTIGSVRSGFSRSLAAPPRRMAGRLATGSGRRRVVDLKVAGNSNAAFTIATCSGLAMS